MKTLFVALLLSVGVSSQAFTDKITVQGNGQVTAKADQVDVSITITTYGANSREALANNADAKKGVVSAIMGMSLNADDLKTPGPTSSVYWVYNETSRKNEKKGWVATNNLTYCLKSSDFSRVGEFIDAVSSVKNVQTGQPSYSSSESEKHKSSALVAAVENAAAKAALLANAAGRVLGAVDDIIETNYGGGRNLYARAAALESTGGGGSETTVNPADLTFSASVTVLFNHSAK